MFKNNACKIKVFLRNIQNMFLFLINTTTSFSNYFTFSWPNILSYHFAFKFLNCFPLNKIFMVDLMLMCINIDVFLCSVYISTVTFHCFSCRWQIQHFLQFSSYNQPCVDSHRSFPLHPSLTSVLLEKWQMGKGQRSKRVVTSFRAVLSVLPSLSHTHLLMRDILMFYKTKQTIYQR